MDSRGQSNQHQCATEHELCVKVYSLPHVQYDVCNAQCCSVRMKPGSEIDLNNVFSHDEMKDGVKM